MIAYDVFVNDPPTQDNGFLPNGDPKGGSPVASTLIYGAQDAVLTDPGFTADRARALGDWVAARVVATPGTIAQMHVSVAARPLLWDRVYPGIPPSPVTAVTVPDNRLTLEGHDLVMVEVGHADTDDNSVLHVPDLALVVAGDVIYNGAHVYLGESVTVGGFGPWRDAIDQVEALRPRHIVAGHQNKHLDDDAGRTIAETRQYLDDADDLLKTQPTAVGFFNAKIERYPSHLARMVLWAGASAIYGLREHPEADIGQILVAGWL